MAKIIAVNRSEQKGTYKIPIEGRAQLVVGFGLERDAHGGDWHRQLSLLAEESIAKMTAQGAKGLVPGMFAENITTSGIELHTLPVGTRLRLGETVVEVTQIGKKCHSDCEIFKKLGKCIMPLEGIFAKVVKGGLVGQGDDVEVIERPIKAHILVASDKAFSGEREDASGTVLSKMLEEIAVVTGVTILPDDRDKLSEFMKKMADEGETDLLITSGGTGLAPRDVTPEATADVLEKAVSGIPEAMRQKSLEVTDRAMLSRALAGIRKKTLIVNMPGSPKACRECMDAIIGALPHAVETMRGEAYECALPSDKKQRLN
ncbi:MAG: molybdopterin-binding protein [Oscillospiraceae bacterium]